MSTKPEVLFVDPAVDDLDHVMAGVRPEVRAVLLDAATPAARQIAAALEGAQGLTCVHIMAHGAPGRVMFSAGAWSTGSLEWDARELAAIGGALGAEGDLRLWSCDTAAGATGAAFVEALARTTGVAVAASDARVGAADKGGSWDLAARAGRPAKAPLTGEAIAAFEDVLDPDRILVSGEIPVGPQGGSAKYFVVDKPTHDVRGEFTLPSASDRMQAFRLLVTVAARADDYDVGVFDEGGRFVSSGFTVEAPPRGAVGART
jgi:hypothetical protein